MFFGARNSHLIVIIFNAAVYVDCYEMLSGTINQFVVFINVHTEYYAINMYIKCHIYQD